MPAQIQEAATLPVPNSSGGLGDQSCTDQPEGIGGLAPNIRLGASEARLLKRAIDNNWPLTPEVRKLVVEQMATVVKDSDEPRAKCAAARVLATVDAVNAKREATETPQQVLHAHVVVKRIGQSASMEEL